jgi:predicted permease
VQTLLQDIRFGLRMLAKNPGFTAVAVLTLALSIGANTAIFSVVYGVLLRPLPYPKPDQIASVSEVASDGHLMEFADPNFDDIRTASQTLAGMAEYEDGDVETVIGPSGAARIGVSSVTRDFFRVMGVSPILGRGFAADDQRQGAPMVALASYGYWQQYLNGSAVFSTFKLEMGGHVFSVVGILPPGFSFPAGAELWFPREIFGETPSRTSHNAAVVARLREGTTLAQVRGEISAIARRLHQEYKPDIDMTDASVVPLRRSLTASVRPALLVLLGAVGFLLLVGCANVANLLLARAAAREREVAIRAALGAGRARLVRQFLVESLLLSLAGGGLGSLLAIWGVDALLALAPRNLPRLENVSVNLPVLAFTLVLSVLVAVGLSVVTALRATAVDPQAALAEGGRGAGVSLASSRLGHILVGGQLAVTLALLAGAGLLGRSLLRVLSVDPGFRTQNIVTMELEVPGSAVTDISSALNSTGDMRPAGFMNNLFDRLRGIPGVRDVGGVSALPLSSSWISDGKFLLLNSQPEFNLSKPEDLARLDQFWVTSAGADADYCIASEGYFRSLGVPLLRGRLFNDHDTMDAPHVALISDSLARAVWPSQDPMGRTIEFGNMDADLRLLTIVGVVGDVRDRSLETQSRPTVYVNYRQRLRAGQDFTVVLRSDVAPGGVLSAAQKIVRDMDPNVAPRFRTFQEVFTASLEARRFNLTLVGVFALTALLLAAVGIYGVTAYWLTRRTHEFGIRMALGAQKGDVLRMVVGQGLQTALWGVAIGSAGALALARLLSSLLYGVKPADPLTFVAVSLILTAVALVACYIPARRATQVDPIVALRYE